MRSSSAAAKDDAYPVRPLLVHQPCLLWRITLRYPYEYSVTVSYRAGKERTEPMMNRHEATGLSSTSRTTHGPPDAPPTPVEGPSRPWNTGHSSLSPSASAATTARAAPTTPATAAATATITITEEEEEQQGSRVPPEVLTLTLRPRPAVRWDETVIDNEGMSRKSSKRCCIFHKQREFGESSTDSSDQDDGGGGSDGEGDGSSGKKPWGRRVARPKKGSVPDYQRFHA
jgi:protein phosphatase 1 regulatory subunit 11